MGIYNNYNQLRVQSLAFCKKVAFTKIQYTNTVSDHQHAHQYKTKLSLGENTIKIKIMQ